MRKYTLLLGIVLISIIISTMFVSAEDIQIFAREYSANITINNLGAHTLKLGFDRNLKYDASAEACLNGCKTLNLNKAGIP